ncbi:MAG: DUF1015 domain-containing protein [Spirochaetaceae bacterium]|nr:DUF1015 domain-containing protein [Spirochaetaceae bacterium]
MSGLSEQFREVGIGIPELYLPSEDVDRQAWAVVACDQYSSERDYWEKVSKFVGDKPSTFNLIYPECYLEDGNKSERIAGIQATMRDYLAKGCLKSIGEGFIIVERFTPYETKPRVGLMVALDLERYDYSKGSTSLIRPTEGTIVERLPPRMAIRRGAALELPHIMVLLDDPEKTVIEPLYAKRSFFPKAYDFDLMASSGHVRGWFVQSEQYLAPVAAALARLADPSRFKAMYGKDNVLLYAVGDGNHSLATAKAIWEEAKASLKGKPDEEYLLANHPARFALVELVNIYDEGLPFHPIHRVLFNVDERTFFAEAAKAGAVIRRLPDADAAIKACDDPGNKAHVIAFTNQDGAGTLSFDKPVLPLAAGSIQAFLDLFLKKYPATTIDYIHGEGSLKVLGQKPGNLGLYLPPVDKGSFFSTVIRNGTMPRKTFSMGEAPEKRFYIEARKIAL